MSLLAMSMGKRGRQPDTPKGSKHFGRDWVWQWNRTRWAIIYYSKLYLFKLLSPSWPIIQLGTCHCMYILSQYHVVITTMNVRHHIYLTCASFLHLATFVTDSMIAWLTSKQACSHHCKQLTTVNKFSFCSMMATLLHWNCVIMAKNSRPSCSAVGCIWK